MLDAQIPMRVVGVADPNQVAATVQILDRLVRSKPVDWDRVGTVSLFAAGAGRVGAWREPYVVGARGL